MIEFAEDMAIDIPKIWEYLGEIQGAMVVGGADYLKLQATAIKPLYEMNKAGILLAEILKTAARRIVSICLGRTLAVYKLWNVTVRMIIVKKLMLILLEGICHEKLRKEKYEQFVASSVHYK